jgi:hypothetical protein
MLSQTLVILCDALVTVDTPNDRIVSDSTYIVQSIRKYMNGRPHTFENADFETEMIGGPRYFIFVVTMCLTMSLTLRSVVSRLIPQSLLKLSVF